MPVTVVGIFLWFLSVNAYNSIDVQFLSIAPSGELHITGTLITPDDITTPVPAIILVHGTGISDYRNGTASFHLPPNGLAPKGPVACEIVFQQLQVFVQLSEYYVQKGFAVLRYDKRTCSDCQYPICPISDPFPPPTCYNFINATINDLTTDVVSAVSYLRKNFSHIIDPAQITLMGYTEGSYILPNVALAVQNPPIKNIIQLMGPGVPLDTQMGVRINYSLPIYQDAHGVCDVNNASQTGTRNYLYSQISALQAANQQLGVFTNIRNDAFPPTQSLTIFGAVATAAYWSSWLTMGDTQEISQVQTSAANLGCNFLTINSQHDIEIPPPAFQPLQTITSGLPNNKGKAVTVQGVTHILIPSDLTTNRISQRVYNEIDDFFGFPVTPLPPFTGTSATSYFSGVSLLLLLVLVGFYFL